MIPAIKSEFRKLTTVRSTYGIILFCVAVTVLVAFYVSGFKQTHNVTDPTTFDGLMTGVAHFLAFFISFAAVLLVTHEYRYNTITYALTSARRRSYVLLAKIIIVSLFSILLTLLMCTLAPPLMWLGLHLKGLSVDAQSLHIWSVVWHAAFYGWFYSMFALIVAVIVRNQVGTFAILFLYPSLGEQLLGLVLKGNAKYLPFQALDALLQGANNQLAIATLSTSHAVAVLVSYVIAGLVIAWLLFMRRDAN